MAEAYGEEQKKSQEDPKGNEPLRVDDPLKPIQVADPIRQEQILKDFIGEFQRYESWRMPYENLWNEIYKLYLSVLQSFKTPTRAKIFIPIVFQVIEAALPKLLNVVAAQREFFEVVPWEEVESEWDVANRIKKLILHQLDKAKFLVKFVDFLKQLLLYGTSYLYIYWLVKRQWVWKREPIREDVSFLGFRLGSRITGWKESKAYEVIERRPEVEVLDVLDVYPDPMAKDEDGGKSIWIRSWVDLDEIKESGKGKYPIYENTESPDLQAAKGSSGTYNTVRQSRFGARGESDPTVSSTGKVEVLSRWGKCDLDGDGIKEETLIVIANRTVLLAAHANNFHHQKRPIIKGAMFPVPGEWYAIGLIEPVVPLQHELNTVRRQRLDNINLILNRMWKVNTLADVDLDTLVSSPNGVVLTDDMGAVEALETPDVTQSAYNDAATIQADIENVTAPRSIQGTPESGRLGRTARGAQLIITQALEKFGTSARLIEVGPLSRMLEMWKQLNDQFIDSDEQLRDPLLYGGLFDKDVRVEDIRAEVRFRLAGSSELIDKEGKINQLVSFFGIFKDLMAPQTVGVIMRKVWTLMGFDKKEMEGSIAAPAIRALLPGQQTLEGTEQNLDERLNNQVTRNGAGAPPSVPGARPASS